MIHPFQDSAQHDKEKEQQEQALQSALRARDELVEEQRDHALTRKHLHEAELTQITQN